MEPKMVIKGRRQVREPGSRQPSGFQDEANQQGMVHRVDPGRENQAARLNSGTLTRSGAVRALPLGCQPALQSVAQGPGLREGTENLRQHLEPTDLGGDEMRVLPAEVDDGDGVVAILAYNAAQAAWRPDKVFVTNDE